MTEPSTLSTTTLSAAAAERSPVDIRRTTFVMRDIDKSLVLYRDALG